MTGLVPGAGLVLCFCIVSLCLSRYKIQGKRYKAGMTGLVPNAQMRFYPCILYLFPCISPYYTAAAPLTISEISCVIAAWRALL